ncbi:MAG: transcriptional regulator, MerR family, mercury resistance [Gammaproteobacteria bacterium]|jgi:DNA-binding transcriptional MerR regulator|nr:transcriptional regulator, MerR family, mercury resistance [Gammaproteobacteria bacterium]MCE3237136.1 transcriptional regulator, MerR family, mercury resistance [Gammaproteobacteria bacterium]
MTQWYVKDLSKLTGVSVQTLHHYDRIELLKPSVRLANGYRVYSEKDLLKLQQIIALKFFGFELLQIKALLSGNAKALEHFSVQAQFLEKKANTLLDASKTLKGIVSNVKDDKSIPWETIIKLIEVYRMTQQLEHAWVKEIFTPEELKQYAAFEAELKSRSTPQEKAAFERNWAALVEEIRSNLKNDPQSDIGIQLGKKCMSLINELYGKKYAHLRTKIFEKGFVEGKGLEETGLTPEIVSWLEKATDAYWRQRICDVLALVGKISSSEVLSLWNELLDDICGEDSDHKKAVLDIAMQDDKVSNDAKKWLQNL